MTRSIKLFSLCAIFLFSNCSKKDKKIYSTWEVNGQKLSSNNVKVVIGKAAAGMACQDQDRFSLNFIITGDALPTQYNFFVAKISDSIVQNPQLVHMDINFQGQYYIPSESCTSILAASVSGDNKAQYVLPPTWFVNYYNHDDSVLVDGNFNEP